MSSDIQVIAGFLDEMERLARTPNPNLPPNVEPAIVWMRAKLDDWRTEYGKMMAAYKAGGGPQEGMHDALREAWRNRKRS